MPYVPLIHLQLLYCKFRGIRLLGQLVICFVLNHNFVLSFQEGQANSNSTEVRFARQR